MATFKNYPYDPELFLYKWQNENDPTLTAMVESGAVVVNSDIAGLIANGSDTYTIPFYKVIGGDEDNYDGTSNITISDVEGGSQTGIVYGRAHAWKEREIVIDFNSGADPMSQIVSQVAKYWSKKRQKRMIKIMDAVFGLTGDTDALNEWELHTTDLSSATTSVADANKFGATTAVEAIQKAVGDARDQFALICMHSKVAVGLEALNLLQYRKYTDPQGIERTTRIADLNGMTVIVDDGCPVVAATSEAAAKYTTYILGNGAIQFASANVNTPSELVREALSGGGYNALVTRLRETIHPNGFSFTKPNSGYTGSPTDDQLASSNNWSLSAMPKNIAMVKVVTNA